MKTTEVNPGDVVYYDIRKKSGELIYTVTYNVLESGNKSVLLEIISPTYLAGVVRINHKDFEKFHKGE